MSNIAEVRKNQLAEFPYSIKGFFAEYRWLSNFHQCPVSYEGVIYPSSENAFQAAKTQSIELRKPFKTCSPADAKSLGRHLDLPPSWEQMRVVVMYQVTRSKYHINEDIRSKLLALGSAYLEETNWWGDDFWGVCSMNGLNMLGKIIMAVRTEIQTEKK
jgi:ribA/ribD-fused uncharacterized protein